MKFITRIMVISLSSITLINMFFFAHAFTQGVDINTVGSSTITTLPDNSVTFNHLVTNTGDEATTYTYSLTLPPSAQFTVSYEGPITFTLAPSATQQLTVEVSVPAQVISGTAEMFTATVVASDTITSDFVTNTTVVGLVGETIETNLTTQTLSGEPGETVVYLFTAENHSNYTDTVNFNWPTLGFPAEVEPSQLLLAPLPGTNSGAFTVTVDIPLTAVAGQEVEQPVHLVSELTGLTSVVTVTTQIEEITGLEVSSNDTQTVWPGEIVTYTHTLTNSGNSYQTFNLMLDHTADITPTASFTSEVGVPAYGQTELMFSYVVPVTASETDLFTTSLTIQGVETPSLIAEVQTITLVGLAAGVTIDPNQDSQTGYKNETFVFTHTITNEGNSSDTFVITATNTSTASVVLSTQAVTLTRNGTATLTVTVTGSVVTNTTWITVTSENDESEFDTAEDEVVIQEAHLFVPLMFTTPPAPTWRKLDSNFSENSLDVLLCPSGLGFIATATGVRYFEGSTISTLITELPSGTGKAVTDLVATDDCQTVYVGFFTADGVWKGTKDGESWSWEGLAGSPVNIRSLTLTNGGTHLVAASSTLSLWDGSSWSVITLPQSNGAEIMSVTNSAPENFNGRLYAVQWQNGRVYTAEASTPSNWSVLEGALLTDVNVRSVFGDAGGNVVHVGTNASHYQKSGSTWVVANSFSLRTVTTYETASFYGYANSAGIFWKQTANAILNSFIPPIAPQPTIIHNLQVERNEAGLGYAIYASTTDGVWVYSR